VSGQPKPMTRSATPDDETNDVDGRSAAEADAICVNPIMGCGIAASRDPSPPSRCPGPTLAPSIGWIAGCGEVTK
jgi:hypothetical protein